MLHNEIRKNEESGIKTLKPETAPWYYKNTYRNAAAVALLVAGTFIGMFFRAPGKPAYTSNEIQQLKTEVTELRKNVMLTMLKEQSSSDRIQAVNYAVDMENADDNVINVLIETLDKDKNVNVRMAAAYALSKFASQKQVTDALVTSLEHQTEPILQITLINILAEKKEKSALGTVQKIISNKNTMKEVRNVAENSLRVLI
jgi:HEAT repeat protein